MLEKTGHLGLPPFARLKITARRESSATKIDWILPKAFVECIK
jgi:hypothetical protein